MPAEIIDLSAVTRIDREFDHRTGGTILRPRDELDALTPDPSPLLTMLTHPTMRRPWLPWRYRLSNPPERRRVEWLEDEISSELVEA